MQFDAKKFLKTKFTPRTEAVPVPDLAAFFPEGSEALWKVRGLTGQELGRVNEAAERNKTAAAVLEAVVSAGDKEKTAAIREMLGIAVNVPPDISRRLALLAAGSVDPPCTEELAVRLCEAFPVEFFQLTQTITRLTGQGHMPGKQPPSGETPTSATASPSPTPGGVSFTKSARTSSRRAT